MYKIRAIWITLIILFLAIIDATALNYLKIYDAKPDFFLITVLFFALYGGLKTGLVAGSFAGLVKDIFAGGVFGTNLLFLISTGIFFGYNFSKFYREKPLTQSVLSFLVSLIYLVFCYIFIKFTNDARAFTTIGADLGYLLVIGGIPLSLYTAIVAPPFFFILRKVLRLGY